MQKQKQNVKRELVNQEIRYEELLVIDENKEKLGLLKTKDALKLADERDLDLVCITGSSEPHVARIVNYNKYKYELKRKEKLNLKKQRESKQETHGIRLTAKTEENDLNFKATTATKFLKGGDKVSINIRFRGRENAHKEEGAKIMDKFYEKLKEVSEIETKPTINKNNMTMVLKPLKK